MPEGGGGGVSLDLTHGFNRLVDNWFDLFSGSTAIDMSANVACAYPSEESVSDIWNTSRPEWYSLRWNQAQRPTDTAWLTRYVMVKLEWDLMVHWQGLTYERDDRTFYFIENCTASCRIVEPANMNLEVQAHFGHPNFYEGIATLPVTFHVKVDDDGTVIREEPVKWVISGQGHRERL
jgi:hypothetical protein